jgi:iron-sulfur cluster assembly protein
MMSAAQTSDEAPSELPRPTVHVSERAAKVMREQLLKRGTPDAAVRFGIRGGGCTGYTYVFEFSDKPARANDHVITCDLPGGGSVRVFVDPKSMLLLDGTKLDFETGMRGHGFKFDNPNVKSDCGCGESISF